MEISPLLIPIMGISCGLLAIFGGVFIRPWFKLKEQQLKAQTMQTAEKAAQYAASQAQLMERVAVLERIVTDQGYSLASEIEALRSLPTPTSPIHEKEVLK
jgi:hypothetical protein